ncbi:hypothetical protein [Rhizobium sp. 11515TR]|uniref:hypothetical protein n=1 Tax=Rhizobium sp. 11515TR TaxID=2028343 RepID=UPI000BA83E5E|nr:hypothetical protein [Rhizobium sp. 11515TR]ASW06255.1 hypothetical protein CKA34_10415 [Rhizobium sp. 11515TR]
MKIEDFGWAAFATDGYPQPYILVHSCRRTRQEVCEYMGESWAIDGETWRKGWKRAYRNGFRVIRVVVRPFGSAPLYKGGE